MLIGILSLGTHRPSDILRLRLLLYCKEEKFWMIRLHSSGHRIMFSNNHKKLRTPKKRSSSLYVTTEEAFDTSIYLAANATERHAEKSKCSGPISRKTLS
jgi:hypothetical protein